jgi:hypothetical protein
MANVQNLRPPFGQRPREETVEAARKGGIKSGEVRRRKKTLKDAAEQIMQMTPPDKVAASLKKQGFGDDDATYQTAMMLAQIQAAVKGDTRAASFIANILGEFTPKPETREADRSFIDALEGTAEEDWSDV